MNDLTGYIPLDEALRRIDKAKFSRGSTNTAARMLGRSGGQVFTNYAATGGRIRGLPKKSLARRSFNRTSYATASLGAFAYLAAKQAEVV